MKKPKCEIYTTYCHFHEIAHGAEALELREGLEKLQQNVREFLINNDDPGATPANDYVEELERLEREVDRLLNKVDARDTEAREMALEAERESA